MLKCLKQDGNERTYWLIQYLAKTGARVSEIIRFTKTNLDDGKCTLWTKGKIREILIPRGLIEESRPYFEKQDGEFLFLSRYGKQMSKEAIRLSLWKLQKYGVPKEVLHPHSFRHLFAIEFLKSNSNIALLADLMGHESVNTTAIYLRLSAKQQREELEKAMKW